MVKCTGRGLAVKRPGVLSKVQMLNLVLGVGVFSLLPSIGGWGHRKFLIFSFQSAKICESAVLSEAPKPVLFTYFPDFQKPYFSRERKLNPNFFFSNFSGTSGISRQNPGISRPKSLISLVSRDVSNFLAPARSRGRPLPNWIISGPKSVGLGSFFLPDFHLLFTYFNFFRVSGLLIGQPTHKPRSYHVMYSTCRSYSDPNLAAPNIARATRRESRYTPSNGPIAQKAHMVSQLAVECVTKSNFIKCRKLSGTESRIARFPQ